MPYSVRDLFGHFIKPESKAGAKCPHPCCNGKRVHPDHLPVMLSKSSVRKLTNEQLAQHMDRDDVRDHKHALARVVLEEQRRERLQAQKAETKARAAKRSRNARAFKQESYRLWLENEWVRAESETRGSLVNNRGRSKGIDGRSLWNASPQVRNAYASEELKAYWDKNPRLTAAEFAAYEARNESAVNEQNKARHGRRLYGVY